MAADGSMIGQAEKVVNRYDLCGWDETPDRTETARWITRLTGGYRAFGRRIGHNRLKDVGRAEIVGIDHGVVSVG
jgi:hypothetical protein